MNIESLASRIKAQKINRVMVNLDEDQNSKLAKICAKMGVSKNNLFRAAIEEIFYDLFGGSEANGTGNGEKTKQKTLTRDQK